MYNKDIKNRVMELKACESDIEKRLYTALYCHFRACFLSFNHVDYVECANGKKYYIRCSCPELKICVEAETKPEYFNRQMNKIKALEGVGYKVFFLPKFRFTKAGIAGLSLDVARYLSDFIVLEDDKVASQHCCLDCVKYYDAKKGRCKILRHKVGTCDMACIHYCIDATQKRRNRKFALKRRQ